MPLLVWTHSPQMHTFEHNPTATLGVSRRRIEGEIGQAMLTLVWNHVSGSIVQKTNRWRYESATRSELTVQTFKNVSMTELAYLPPHLLRAVYLCQCKLSHGKLTKTAAPKAHSSDSCRASLPSLPTLEVKVGKDCH